MIKYIFLDKRILNACTFIFRTLYKIMAKVFSEYFLQILALQGIRIYSNIFLNFLREYKTYLSKNLNLYKIKLILYIILIYIKILSL